MTTPVPTTVVRLNADIAGTFGGSATGVATKMSSYYKGGTNVTSGQATSATDGTAIPTSGTIRIGEFRGLSKTAAAALSGTVSPTTVSGSQQGATAGVVKTVTTVPAAVTATGGTSPYTYAWTLVSGTAATVVSASAASTSFTRNMAVPAAGQTTSSGIYKCTITDAAGATFGAPNVTVTTICSNSTT